MGKVQGQWANSATMHDAAAALIIAAASGVQPCMKQLPHQSQQLHGLWVCC
jgi:hypothetical protein